MGDSNMRRLTLLAAATCLSLASPALAGPAEDFKSLTDDYWAFLMTEFPTWASTLGMHEADDRLVDLNLRADE